jgi:holin-like protein
MNLPLHTQRLRGIFFILLFYLLGTIVSAWTGHLIPGSVAGMMLLFFSLLFRIIRPETVKHAAHLLTSTMALFFIPAGVGVMVYWDVIAGNWLIIVTVCVVSTVLVIGTVGWIQEAFERKSAHE